MPANLQHFTQCAAPGNAHTYSVPTALAIFVASGGVAGFIAWVWSQAFNLECAVSAGIITGIVVGLIVALDDFKHWYYNFRLMCIDSHRCVIGTVAGTPHAACDGDRKIDLLVAPFRILEVEITMAHAAATSVASADNTFPAPPPFGDYLANRELRLEYVNGIVPSGGALLAQAQRLNESQRQSLYQEIVHRQMFIPPGPGSQDRRFQQYMYIRIESEMGTNSFNNSDDDRYGIPGSNPMYRWEKESVSGAGFFGWFFCDLLLGHPADDPGESRLVPYLHNEIEGNRLERGVTNFQITLAAFAAGIIAACAVCHAIPVVGQLPFVCTVITIVVGALFALLAWLLSKLFNDPDDGEAGEISVDVPTGPEVTGGPEDDVGDLVLIYGRWVMDAEHENYFEIHPVLGWYRIARDRGGAPILVDDLGDLAEGQTPLTASDIDEQGLKEMCGLVDKAEKDEAEPTLTGRTAKFLSMARGLE